MAEYVHALDYFVSDDRTFAQNSCSAIVLHCTGSDNPNQTAQQLGDYFRTTPLETSVHYGIDRNGVVAQYCLEERGAGGNCCTEPGYDPFWDQFNGDNLNKHTISIECVNDVNNSLALTAPQKAALFDLVSYLSKKYTIPYDHIKSHASIAPSSRAHCPGPQFPWDELKTYLQQPEVSVISLSQPEVANYFTQAPGGAWHCTQTNCVIGGAILDFYRLYGNSALNGITYLGLPTTNEVGLGNGAVQQRYERGILVYDPAHKFDSPPMAGSVYLAHIDQVPPPPASQPDALKQSLLTTMHNIFLAASAYEGKR